MSRFHVERLTGDTDGANTVFGTSVAYIAGSLQLFPDGLPRVQDDDDGWVEVDSLTVRTNEPPAAEGWMGAMFRTLEAPVGLPVFEIPSGAIDGANTVFTTAAAYTAGTLMVWRDGVLRAQNDDDGWTETDPAAGTLTMNEAPLTDDHIETFSLDTTAAERVGITPILGVL